MKHELKDPVSCNATYTVPLLCSHLCLLHSVCTKTWFRKFLKQVEMMTHGLRQVLGDITLLLHRFMIKSIYLLSLSKKIYVRSTGPCESIFWTIWNKNDKGSKVESCGLFVHNRKTQLWCRNEPTSFNNSASELSTDCKYVHDSFILIKKMMHK